MKIVTFHVIIHFISFLFFFWSDFLVWFFCDYLEFFISFFFKVIDYIFSLFVHFLLNFIFTWKFRFFFWEFLIFFFKVIIYFCTFLLLFLFIFCVKINIFTFLSVVHSSDLCSARQWIIRRSRLVVRWISQIVRKMGQKKVAISSSKKNVKKSILMFCKKKIENSSRIIHIINLSLEEWIFLADFPQLSFSIP